MKVIQYWGNAEDIVDPAVKMGWEYIEGDHLDRSGQIDWDKVLHEATAYLKERGYYIEYN